MTRTLTIAIKTLIAVLALAATGAGWLQDPGPYGLIARFYGVTEEPTRFTHTNASGHDVYVLETPFMDHSLAEGHNEGTCAWLLKRAELTGKEQKTFIAERAFQAHLAASPRLVSSEAYFILRHSGPAEELAPLDSRFTLRPLTANDAPALLALYAEHDGPTPFVPSTFDAMKFLQHPTMGAFDNGRLAAVVGVFGQTSQEIEVGRLFTSPRYRGQGLAAHVLTALLQSIRISGENRPLYAWVRTDNIASQRALSRSGFETVGDLVIAVVRPRP